MVDLVAFGDFHASQNGEFSRSVGPSGLSPLGERLIETAKWIRVITKEGNIPLLNNGDFTSVPGVIDAPTNYLLTKLQDQFLGADPDWANYCINLGNHDLDSKVGLSNLHLLQASNCVVVSAGEVTRWNGIYVVPFTFDLQAQRDLLATIPDGAIVAVHTPIIGVLMTPGVAETSGVEAELFKRFRLTISSHYHLPQINGEVVDGGCEYPIVPGTFISLGAPLARTFADTNSAYGIWRFDLSQENKASFEPNPFSPIYTNQIPDVIDSVREIFVSLDLSDVEANEQRERIQALPDNVHVRVRKKATQATQARSAVVTSSPIENVLQYLEASSILHDPIASRELLAGCLLGATPTSSLGGRVEFHRLRIENFFSFETAEVAFAKGGLTYVSGINHDTSAAASNGSGKSSLFESLVWCLYDQTLRDLEDGKDSLIRKGQDRASVSVDFSIEGQSYTVTRSRTKGKPTVSLFSDGKDISRGLAPTANQQILTLLGIPYNVFIASTFFTNSPEGRFSLMTDSARKKFLASSLGEDLSVYETIKENLSTKSKEHDRALTYLKGSVETSQKALIGLTERVGQEELHAAASELKRESELVGLKASLLEISSQFNQASTLMKEKELELESLPKSSEALQVARPALVSTLQFLLRDHEKANLPITTLCLVCGQDLPGGKIQPLKIAQAASVSELGERISLVQEKISALDADIAFAEAASQSTRALELVIAAFKSKRDSFRLQATVRSKEISDLQSMDYRVELRSLEKHIQGHTAKLEEASAQLEFAQAQEAQFSVLLSALSPTGVVSYILDSTVEELNTYLDAYGKMIFSGDYSLSLSSTKSLQSGKESNKISLQYSTEGGSYGLSSSGEKRKADIALFLSLNTMLSAHGRGSTNLIVADEALDSLDPVAASVLIEGLSLFAKESGKAVYLTSHSGDVTALVDQAIVVTRQNGISRCNTIN